MALSVKYPEEFVNSNEWTVRMSNATNGRPAHRGLQRMSIMQMVVPAVCDAVCTIMDRSRDSALRRAVQVSVRGSQRLVLTPVCS